MGELARMGGRDNSWHFSARNASTERIESFSIANMARHLKEQTPHLWQILSLMLVSDPIRESWQVQYLEKEVPKEPSEMMVGTEGLKPSCSQVSLASQTWDKEDEYWACDTDGELETKADDNDNDNNDDGRPTK
jgi:hypothetical protein